MSTSSQAAELEQRIQENNIASLVRRRQQSYLHKDLTILQYRARSAVPLWQKRKPGPVGRWSPLWPVYAELRRKGFTIREAVDWLIRESAIPASDRKKAEYGLPMVDSRRRREGAEAEGKTIKAGRGK